MAIKYLVGIDFGDGETTASCYEIGKEEDKAITHLKINDSTNGDKFKCQSVVYQIFQEDGTYSYQLNYGGNEYAVHISFKDEICELNKERKEAFQNFIKLIYERIISNNSFLTEKDNEFLLYVACPTKWNKNSKKDYKIFVEKAINRPIEWVINESDAAYYQKKGNGLVLVVDFGSSTIDYTLIYNNKKINIDHLSKRLGARLIELDLLNYYKSDTNCNYKECKERSENVKLKTGNSHLEIDTLLKLEIRNCKEDTYTRANGTDPKLLLFSAPIELIYMGIQYEEVSEYRINFFNFEKDNKKGIKNYIDSVSYNFGEVKDEVYKICKERNIDPTQLQIILSGGASIMPWVRKSLQEIFNTKIEKDSLPEYIVSDGIVKYAYALWNVKTKLIEVEYEFDEWANESLKNIFEKAISEACIKVELKELQAEKCENSTWVFKHPFTAKEPNYNINDFIDTMKKHNETITNKKKNEINNQIKEAIRPQLNEKICSSFNSKLANILGMTMKIEKLNLCPAEINLLPKIFSIAENEQRTINRCTDALKKWWIGPEWLWANTNQTPIKPRDQSARIAIMKFYTASLDWKNYADLIFKDNNIDNYILEIKESAKKALISIVTDALIFNPCGYDLKKELLSKNDRDTTSNNFTSFNTEVEKVFSMTVTYVAPMGPDSLIAGEIKLGKVAKGDTLFIGYNHPQMVHVKEIFDNGIQVGGIVRMLLDCNHALIKAGATVHSKTF